MIALFVAFRDLVSAKVSFGCACSGEEARQALLGKKKSETKRGPFK